MSQLAADTTEHKRPGGYTQPNQQGIYCKVAPYTDEIITRLVEIMRSRNESNALGAAKVLINKLIPDLKSTEIKGENGEPIRFNIISGADYVSALGKIVTASEASTLGRPTEVQSTDMAQAGTQDNNGNQSVSEVVSA